VNAEWEHLLPLVSALERGGNPVLAPAFRPVEGGYECVMQAPLDFELLRPFIGPNDKDVHLAESSDMVWCSHCWTAIIGPRRIAEADRE
jgi:hypothetical protein